MITTVKISRFFLVFLTIISLAVSGQMSSKSILDSLEKLAGLDRPCVQDVKEILPFEFVDEKYKDPIFNTEVPFNVFRAKPPEEYGLESVELRPRKNPLEFGGSVVLIFSTAELQWEEVTHIADWDKLTGISSDAGGRKEVIKYLVNYNEVSFSRLRGSQFVSTASINYKTDAAQKNKNKK